VERVEMLAAGLAVALLFAGIFLPIVVLPGWLATVGRLFPMTHSRQSLRAMLVDGPPLTTLWGDGGLVRASTSGLAAGRHHRLLGRPAHRQAPRQARPALIPLRGPPPAKTLANEPRSPLAPRRVGRLGIVILGGAVRASGCTRAS
jgi:hypothetical protein